jgi:hypothetical protein
MQTIMEIIPERKSEMSTLKRTAVAALLFGLPIAAAADDPPKLDVNTTCNAAAQFAIMAGRDRESCLKDERSAESTLAQNWLKYTVGDKAECVATVKVGGPPSYVELLSCLESMRGARDLREGGTLVPSDEPASPGK